MKFMLDTNMCIYIIRQKPERVLRRFRKLSPGDIGISSITLSELYYGAEKSQHIEKNIKALEEFILPLEVAPFDENAARIYGKVRAYLERRGEVIGAMDMLIGAHALSLGVPLVTSNVREFRRIKNLRVVDWTR